VLEGITEAMLRGRKSLLAEFDKLDNAVLKIDSRRPDLPQAHDGARCRAVD
jgi:hypothetical protein